MMRAAMEKGQWVFFQNCHLSPSWMPTLERLVEQVDPDHVRLTFHRFSHRFFISKLCIQIIPSERSSKKI